jgi:hypothetical protein
MTPPAGPARPGSHAAGSPPGPLLQRSFKTDVPAGARSPGQAADRPGPGSHHPGRGTGGRLLIAASGLLLLLAAAQGYVSFRAQYVFVDSAKHAHLPSLLEALGLDTGAVIFALLALSLARHGGRARAERSLNVACAVGSLTMNLLAASLASPRSITVWVLPSALYALASDRLIAVVGRWVRSSDPDAQTGPAGSAWRAFGGLGLWLLRLALDVPGTLSGFRRWVLAVAPVAPDTRHMPLTPGERPQLTAASEHNCSCDCTGRCDTPGPASAAAPASPASMPPASDVTSPPGRLRGETKREALIRLYEHRGAIGDPRYGSRARAAALAGEIAAQIGYHPGTARRELARYLASRNGTAPASDPSAQAQPRR